MNYEEVIRLGQVYSGMFNRCYSKKNSRYDDYGGRGIYICDEWLNDRNKFIEWGLKNGSALGLHLDRIDNNGPYAPWNCQFVTPKVNASNKRNNTRITIFGESKTLAQWSEDPRCAVSASTLGARLVIKWSPEAALTTPLNERGDNEESYNASVITAWGESKTAKMWLKDDRCPLTDHRQLWDRIFNLGWSPEEAIVKPIANNAGVLYEGKTVLQWYKDARCMVGYNTLNNRLKEGWGVVDAMQTPARAIGKKYPAVYEGQLLTDLKKHPDLVVSDKTLEYRLRKGWTVEAALKTPVKTKKA